MHHKFPEDALRSLMQNECVFWCRFADSGDSGLLFWLGASGQDGKRSVRSATGVLKKKTIWIRPRHSYIGSSLGATIVSKFSRIWEEFLMFEKNHIPHKKHNGIRYQMWLLYQLRRVWKKHWRRVPLGMMVIEKFTLQNDRRADFVFKVNRYKLYLSILSIKVILCNCSLQTSPTLGRLSCFQTCFVHGT